MRLDHLLSKEVSRGGVYCLVIKAVKSLIMNFGGDALRGDTRSHPEHDGKDLSGRWYCTGDGVGEQVAARLKKKVKGTMRWPD